jgi:hypothetical protein
MQSNGNTARGEIISQAYSTLANR